MKAIFEIGPVEQEIFWEGEIKEDKQNIETKRGAPIDVSYEITWRYQSSDGFKRFTK